MPVPPENPVPDVFIRVDNGVIVGDPSPLPLLLTAPDNTERGLIYSQYLEGWYTLADIRWLGWWPVVEVKPEYDPETRILVIDTKELREAEFDVVVTYVVSYPPLGPLKATRITSIEMKRDAVQDGGYLVPSGPLAGKTLQTSGWKDSRAWLVMHGLYSRYVLNGDGAVMGAKFRATDGTRITVSYADGLDLLTAIGEWGVEVSNYADDLIDDTNAAADHVTFYALPSIETGWPGGA